MNNNKQYQGANNNYHRPNNKNQVKKYIKYRPQQNRRPQQNQVTSGYFQGNLVQNMKFGGKDHDLSGYVQRTLVIKDSHGNVQIAKEKQFFNSSKNGFRVRINDNDKF